MQSIPPFRLFLIIAFVAVVLTDSGNASADFVMPRPVDQTPSLPPVPPPDPNTVSAGFYHSCAIRSGNLRCWGDNRDGQIGDGTTTERHVPTVPTGLNGIATETTAGAYHTCVLINGGVKCWGHNSYGQVGDGTTTHRTEPLSVIGLGGGIKAIAAGGFHTCVLTDLEKVKCWGANSTGQLGEGTTTDRSTPIDVLGLAPVVAISAGYAHTCALDNLSRAWCWGDNSSRQLGDGTTADHRTQPVQVTGLNGTALAIAAGGAFTCALMNDGAVQCWGDNFFGELGDGTTVDHALPAKVLGLNGAARAIATGTTSACAIVGQDARCWGDNSSGQLGDDTTANRSYPVQVTNLNSPLAVAVGDQHACAQTIAGLKCWGRQSFGELGDNGSLFEAMPVDVVGLANAEALQAGGHHTCALANGDVECWGWNSNGQVGDGTTRDRLTPTRVAGLERAATLIAVGYAHNCLVTNGGAVRCWGRNAKGQIGDGTLSDKSRPANVIGLDADAHTIAAGFSHSCLVLTSGKVKCWGENSNGELGNGEYGNGNMSPTPVSVMGLDGVIQVAAGYHFSCALTTAGGAKCWGWNFYGQLGDGTTNDRHTPVSVSGLTSGVLAISAGWYHACAVMTNGDLKCWGANGSGQIGDGTTVERHVPVNVSGLTTSVSNVAAGWAHTCARLNSGGVKCWGWNVNGALGDGTTNSSLSPVFVSGLQSGALAVSTGQNYSCALTVNHNGKCWGFNYYGTLGNNHAGHRPTPVDVSWTWSAYFPLVTK